MLRKSITSLLRPVGQICTRSFAMEPAVSVGSLLKLDVDDKSGIATLSLNRPPVNSLNLEMLTQISQALDQVGANRSRGLILTSTGRNIFTAGLDLTDLQDLERSKQSWITLQDLWLKLFGSAYPTAAAINGHSPAGGCLLASCCEYRVMLPNYTIGLNETRLGVVAPTFFENTYLSVLPRRIAERALALGTMFSTEEALRVGLIDEVADDKEDALRKCTAFIEQFRTVVPNARAKSKQSMRRQSLDELRNNREQDLNAFLFSISDPKTMEILSSYLANMKK